MNHIGQGSGTIHGFQENKPKQGDQKHREFAGIVENQDIGQEIAGTNLDYVLDAETGDTLLRTALKDQNQDIPPKDQDPARWWEIRRIEVLEVLRGVEPLKGVNQEKNIEVEHQNSRKF